MEEKRGKRKRTNMLKKLIISTFSFFKKHVQIMGGRISFLTTTKSCGLWPPLKVLKVTEADPSADFSPIPGSLCIEVREGLKTYVIFVQRNAEKYFSSFALFLVGSCGDRIRWHNSLLEEAVSRRVWSYKICRITHGQIWVM